MANNFVTISGYSDSPSGHVSIQVGDRVFEQQQVNQTDEFTYHDASQALTSTGSVEDGIIQQRPQGELISEPSNSISIPVTAEQQQAMQSYIDSVLGPNNYGLLGVNCVEFVDNVLLAGEVLVDWRELLSETGGIPEAKPVEISIAMKHDGIGMDRSGTRLDSDGSKVDLNDPDGAITQNSDGTLSINTIDVATGTITKTTWAPNAVGTLVPIAVVDVNVDSGGYSSTGNDWGNEWNDPRTDVKRGDY